MVEWRTMDSVPKPDKIGGETFFLLWNGEDMWAAEAYCWADGHVDIQCHGCDGYDYYDRFENPTHWAPMPDPPS